MVEILITEKNENQRVDKYIQKFLNTAPKSFVYKMIRKKNIKLNGQKILGKEIVKSGDLLTLYMSDETVRKFRQDKEISKINMNFGIVFEDDNIILAYKPTGVASQPDVKNSKNSLNDQLIYYLYSKGEYVRNADYTPSICNRLDVNTSGIVCFGKNFKTLQVLNHAFKNKTVDKYYLTVVEGKITKSSIVTLYHKKENDNVVICDSKKDGYKEVITKYTPIEYKNNMTLLEVKLITGKTHQIRAVFEYIGYPLVGDPKYNKNKSNIFGLKSQFLHGYKISFADKIEGLDYLNGRSFLCSEMSEVYKSILSYFDYKIEVEIQK